MLLGVRAVIAESFERIHRSNLVGMGVLPLQFLPGESAASLGLTGRETLSISGLAGGPTPRQTVTVIARADDGTRAPVRGDRPARRPDRRRLLPAGGILPAVLRRLAAESWPGPGRRRSGWARDAGHEEALGGGTEGFYAEEQAGVVRSDERPSGRVTPSDGHSSGRSPGSSRRSVRPTLPTSRATADTR